MVSVLLVDNDPAASERVVTSLENGGFCVYKAHSAREAAVFLKNQSYDAIISDIGLWDQIKPNFFPARYGSDARPVIIFIGDNWEETAIEAMNNGADYYLQKSGCSPEVYKALIRFINTVSQRTKPIRELNINEECVNRVQSNIGSLIDSIPAPVFFRDIMGTYKGCNKAFETLIKRNKEEIIDETIQDIFPPELADHYRHMDDLIIRNPYVQQYEYSITDAGGEKHDVLFSKNALTDPNGSVEGIIGVIFDISEKKRFEQIILESEEKYRTLAEYTHDWEAWLSPEGVYLYVSPSCERITGYCTDEFIQDPNLVIKITHPEDLDTITDHYRMKPDNTKEIIHIDYRIITKNGEERWISHFCQSVFREDGTWLGRRENKRDITFRKKIERAHQQANMKLNLLSSITRHDILNQCTALIGYTGMARDLSGNPEVKDMLGHVMDAATAITRQISFTRIYQEIGLNEPIWQQVHSAINHATEGIRIGSITIDARLLGIEVCADPLLEKVFFCLLDNSERHGKRVTSARFSCNVEKDGLILIYEDDGIGIEDSEKEVIFSRGFGKNTGYGLFLAREILAISGNTIRETGVHQQGARFEIWFSLGRYRSAS